MGFFPLFLKILAPKHTQKTDKVCLHSLYNRTTNKIKSENQKVMKIETVKRHNRGVWGGGVRTNVPNGKKMLFFKAHRL